MQLVSPLLDDDPRRIGPFALQGRLGKGGFGVVYLAHDGRGHPAAVKVMNDEVVSGPDRYEHLARFRRETDVLGEFAYPGVPALLKAGKHTGLPYLATTFVPGPTLDAIVKTTAQLPSQAVLWLGYLLADIPAALPRVRGPSRPQARQRPGDDDGSVPDRLRPRAPAQRGADHPLRLLDRHARLRGSRGWRAR